MTLSLSKNKKKKRLMTKFNVQITGKKDFSVTQIANNAIRLALSSPLDSVSPADLSIMDGNSVSASVKEAVLSEDKKSVMVTMEKDFKNQADYAVTTITFLILTISKKEHAL